MSGRDGRARQGEAQRNDREVDIEEGSGGESDGSDGSESQERAIPAVVVARASRYSLWCAQKTIMSLQAIIQAPNRLFQTNSWPANKSHTPAGLPKNSLARLQ
jgi:hypothetical protein